MLMKIMVRKKLRRQDFRGKNQMPRRLIIGTGKPKKIRQSRDLIMHFFSVGYN